MIDFTDKEKQEISEHFKLTQIIRRITGKQEVDDLVAMFYKHHGIYRRKHEK